MLYPIVIERGDDTHAFGVIIPDLPGCFSAGDTLDEAMRQVHEAIDLHLSGLAEDGEDIPVASSLDAALARHPGLAGPGFIWAVVDVDITRYLGKAEKVNVTLPSRLIHLIDARVAGDKRFKSRSGFLAAGAEMLLRQGGT